MVTIIFRKMYRQKIGALSFRLVGFIKWTNHAYTLFYSLLFSICSCLKRTTHKVKYNKIERIGKSTRLLLFTCSFGLHCAPGIYPISQSPFLLWVSFSTVNIKCFNLFAFSPVLTLEKKEPCRRVFLLQCSRDAHTSSTNPNESSCLLPPALQHTKTVDLWGWG